MPPRSAICVAVLAAAPSPLLVKALEPAIVRIRAVAPPAPPAIPAISKLFFTPAFCNKFATPKPARTPPTAPVPPTADSLIIGVSLNVANLSAKFNFGLARLIILC